jgi:hypothetical protein
MAAPGPQALTTLGSDLTFSVSFALAMELREQADVLHVSQSQLIALLLLLTVILGRLPLLVDLAGDGVDALYKCTRGLPRKGSVGYAEDMGEVGNDEGVGEEGEEGEEGAPGAPGAPGAHRQISAFLRLFIDIARRITSSLLVQIVARNVVSNQPLRASRVVSLLTITIFFVFLQSGAMISEPATKRPRRHAA